MTKPGSKDIILAEIPKPRAIILGQDKETQIAILKNLFVGEHTDFYAAQAARSIASSVTVVGCTTEDCFEMALQKPSPYIGDSADYYMTQELKLKGFTPKIVSQEDFKKLLADVPANGIPQT